ncbi:MAG: thioredoxin domain-containing protein [Planctomycetota bacterium]|nr:thioredoxin domain-containing protein [Planctomycetota bacterium]
MASTHNSEISAKRFILGTLALGVALGLCVIQTLDVLGAMDAPGCGAQSDCHAASSSAFGALPYVHWPLAYVGVAWFAGLLVAWIRTRGELDRAWIWIARIGVAASLFYGGVLAGRGFVCPYCIAVHVANLGFFVVLEMRGAASATPRRNVLVPVAGTAAAVALALAFLDGRFENAARAHAEVELAATAQQLKSSVNSAPATAFTGRHRRGPANARARIVVFTDYQCEDCHAFEAELERVMAATPDASLSIRHFPMCTACNPHAIDMHPNACWAARASEAAAIVGGDAAFWRMHAWLFARRGSFTETELDQGLLSLGFDRTAFLAAMHSPETLTRVRQDIDLAMHVGLGSTPMIFVNGVELRGYSAPNALSRALAAVRADAGASTVDQPPSARERFLAEWRNAPRTNIPIDTKPHVLGRVDAPVQIVVFGDYQEPYTCEVDVMLRSITLANPRVSYSFRCFPANKACNITMEKDIHPRACLAAMAAEAAGILQGNDGFWALHDWLTTHRETFDDVTVTTAAEELGMARADFLNALVKPEIQLWTAEDVRAAKDLGLTSIPLVFVDGRRIGQWKAGNENLLPTIVAEASQ